MSFRRYPKYKDSGVEWLGEVPEHWEVDQTKRLFRLVAEPAPDDNDCELLSIYTEIGVRPRKDLEAKGNKATTTDGYWKVQKGDLIVNKLLAWMGAIGISEYDGVTSPAYDILRKVRPLEPQFYDYLFRCGICFTEFRRYSRGIMDMRLRLYFEDLGQLRMPFPPIEDQRQIISFLDRETSKIDSLVAEQRRLIELLKEKRQAVISHAVTKGLNPHAPMKPSGIEWLGDVPEHWTVKKLGRAAFMQEGPGLRTWQFTDEGTRVICVTNITDNGIDFSRLEKFISTDEYHSSYKHFTVKSGDILLSSSGNSWGKVSIYHGDENVMLNTSTIRLNETAGQPLIRDFLPVVLQSITVREQLGLAMTGSCQPNFGPTHLNAVMVTVPPSDEQSKIVAFLDAETAKLDDLTGEAERAIELLQERRAALISAAVTGKIDVRKFGGQEAS